MADIRIIVGLGNPGDEYAQTRHNAGFRVVDLLAETLGIDVKQKKFGARFGTVEYKDKKLILLKPWNYMNRSGQAVATAVGFYKLDLRNLLVISDDLAIDAGRIRVRAKGSAGGQKGLADVLRKLGTEDIARLRVGIGNDERMLAEDYVLNKPGKEERPLLDKAIARAGEAVFCWIEQGVEAAMNKFNEFNGIGGN